MYSLFAQPGYGSDLATTRPEGPKASRRASRVRVASPPVHCQLRTR
jgi:hypothetical protein